MPLIISEDENTVTYQKDDGSEVRVLKSAAEANGIYRPGDKLAVFDAPMGEPDPASFEQRPAEPLPGSMIGTTPGEAAIAPDRGLIQPEGEEVPPPPVSVQQTEMQPSVEATPAQSQSHSVSLKTSRPGEAEELPAEPEGPKTVPFSTRSGINMAAKGFGAQADAALEAADAESKGREEEAALKVQRAKEADEQEARFAQEEQARAAERESMAANLDAEIQKGLDAKIDRGQFWSSRSTGQKILAGIGLALGAVGASTGNRNHALDLIMKAIDDDVKDQMAGFEQQKAKVGMLEGQLQGFDTGTQRMIGAQDRAIARGLAKTKRDVEIIADKTASKTVKAQAAGFIGQLQQAYGEKLHNWADNEQQFEEKKRHAKKMEGIAGYNARTSRMSAKRQAEEFAFKKKQAAKAAAQANARDVIYNPITGQTLPSRWAGKPQLVRKSQERMTGYAQARDKLTEYMHRLNEAGRVYKGPGADNPKVRDMIRDQAAREAEMMLQEITRDWLKTKEEGGRFSKEDVEQAKEALGGNLKGLLQKSDPGKALKSLIIRMDREAVSSIAAETLTPIPEIKRFVYDTADEIDRQSLTRAKTRTAKISAATPVEANYKLSQQPGDNRAASAAALAGLITQAVNGTAERQDEAIQAIRMISERGDKVGARAKQVLGALERRRKQGR